MAHGADARTPSRLLSLFFFFTPEYVDFCPQTDPFEVEL
jgi:hypothetical protein